ncbi:hybrid sensor histidine kinase/response regulator transcription factor [Echinicola rosea]|uniref:histidine kinase n=1 Tax=Echinicola rosea TaxID=1807691 RepID=A0ABQ1UZ14_9BACT|nr:two-component regulator propeller domain-containing protein [Echinicola rosea]GGF31013.1 hybrid sensor histidine kinase/response regulator [Echinicola rosea]
MKLPVITLLLSFILASLADGQEKDFQVFPKQNQLNFYLLDVESGLSHNYVNSIEQDSLGFIWVATMEGLSRYDGQTFTVYRKNNRVQHTGPLNNYIQHIYLDHKQQLILSTFGGLSIYRPKTDEFIHKTKVDGLLKSDVTYATGSPSGKIALAIYNGGVQLMDAKGKIQTIPSMTSKNSPNADKTTSLSFQGDTVLWVGTFDKGLSKIDLLHHTVTTAGPAISKNINCLYGDDNGNLWIGTGEGIQVITTKGDTLNMKATTTPNVGLSDANVLCFEKGPYGNVWAGTRNGGLTIIPASNFLRTQHLDTKWYLPKSDGSSVFNRTVASLKLAQDGKMWIGTSTGVNVVNPKGDPIYLIQRNLSLKHTIAHDRIGAFEESRNGKIWIGTDGGGLDLYEPSSGRIKHFEYHSGDPHSLSNNYILSLLENEDHNIWVGTYQGGLNLLNPRTGYCKHYLQGSQENGNDVRVIFRDSQNQIWAGTNRGGLYRYHPPLDDFDYVKQLGKIDIRDIVEDQQGNLWLATYGNGIIRYNYLTGERENYNESTVFGFPGNIIFNLCILDNGDILAGTRYEGLIRFNPSEKTVAQFKQENGLGNNTINSIVKDNSGKIWLGTSNGISYFDQATNKVGNLNGYNNIQRSEFNIGASLVSKSGNVYLGGNKGINVFDPQSIKQHRGDYPLLFTDLRLMNKKVNAKDFVSATSPATNIPYLDKIKLNYNQSLFSLDFVALKYPQATDISYAYKLEPYHDHWIETQQSGTANLSNIPPGDYILKIRASDNSDHFAQNQMAVIITPPFWQTWPAYLIYLIVLAALTWGGVNYYADRLKLKNSLLFEKKQRHLEHELNEERVRFFTGFSHELKTPLTLIMAPVNDLLLETKNGHHIKGLKLIQKNAKYLMEMINKLLEYRKTALNGHQLNREKHRIVKPIKQWVDQYHHLAKHKNIKLQVSFPKREFIATVDLEKLHIIINNLLSNAIKFCNPKDQVFFQLYEEDTSFVITVKDSGPGIPAHEHGKIFNWYYQSSNPAKHQGAGIGLAMTKRLITDHQGKIALKSEEGKGSEFTVTIPKNEAPSNIKNYPSTHQPNDWHLNLPKAPVEAPTSNLHLKTAKTLVLLIDDNADILHYLNGLLESCYDLIYAENGQEGLEKAIKYIPDIIISDIMMPKKNGIDLCMLLKKQPATTHIPIILLSAKDSVESITSGFGEGADAYITKPFNGQILKSRIENLLTTRYQLRQYYLGQKHQDKSLTVGQRKAVTQEKAFLKQLEEHIVNQLGEQATEVETLCRLMGMSRTSLFRKLKALTGQNINQYTRTVKINRAAYLIKNENLGVAQAAYEVGFNSPKYFRKLFKEQFGHLPSEKINIE